MNSKKFLKIFLLVVLLFAFVKAEEEDDSKDLEEVVERKEVNVNEEVKNNDETKTNSEEPKSEPSPEPKPEPEPSPEPSPEPKPKPSPEPKPTTSQIVKKPTTTKAPAPQKTNGGSKTGGTGGTKSNNGNTESSKSINNNNEKSNTPSRSSNNPNVSKNNSSNNSSNSNSNNKVNNNANTNTNTNTNANANNAGAANPVVNGAAGSNVAQVTNTNNVVPQVNNVPATGNVSSTSNVSADNNVENKEEGSSNVVTTTVISLVAVGAVVGVATVGVNVYKKKNNNNDESRGVDMAEVEAQPVTNDYGNDMSPENYNPYNIMNDTPNEPYVTNNPYEYKPSYNEDIMDTTPFQKNEPVQDNFMSRESIFSNSGNIPQIGNVYNFGDNAQLPYVQEQTVENSYIEEPVASEIQVENYEQPNSQMPTLVPVQPEIVVSQPEEEPAQEGYKHIVPNIAQMEIIETPDFNNMTTSMIEDHINNMDLEQLANTETNNENDGGYKQIVPDIQEATIENFDVEDDEEEHEFSVDNITDTYRAALRATYCSTNDDNRFSYRTVDSDHSLLHNMRENGEW